MDLDPQLLASSIAQRLIERMERVKHLVERLGVERFVESVVSSGLASLDLVNQLREVLEARDSKIVSMRLLEGVRGIEIRLEPLDRLWMDFVTLRLLDDGSFYLEAESIPFTVEDLGPDAYGAAVSRLAEAYRRGAFMDLCGAIEDRLLECCGGGEVRLFIDDIDGIALITLEIFGTRWRCIPRFSELENVFREMFRRCSIEPVR